MKIVFTDLDGTLLNNDWILSDQNRKTLIRLGHDNITRVVVTGRSLYSAQKVLPPDFPIDYLIFSTGAGIMEWKTKEIIYMKNISEDAVRLCSEILVALKINFMLHREIPTSHYFSYFRGNHTPDDFHHRLQLYGEFAQPFDFDLHTKNEATQFLSILTPVDFEKAFRILKKRIDTLSIIKTTSPLLQSSMWLEIYASGVSKGHAADYLATKLKIKTEDSMAIGNDFNDRELLDWSRNSFIVANASQFLKEKYRPVSANINDGFSEAVRIWLDWND